MSRLYTLRHGTVAVGTPVEWAAAAAIHAAARTGLYLAAHGPIAHRRRRERSAARAIRTALRLDLRIEGAVPAGGPYVVVSLHESLVDPLAILALPLPLRWLVRDEILTWHDVGPHLRAAGHIALSPEQGRTAYRRMLRGAAEAFAAGESLAVFPQGTLLGIETRFAPGAFRLAERLGRPVLPVVLTGTHRVWEHPFGPRLRFGQEAAMRVLAPVSIAELRASGHSAVRDRVEREMKAAALDGTGPPPRRFDPRRDGFWDGYRYEIDAAFPDLARQVAEHRAAIAAGRG